MKVILRLSRKSILVTYQKSIKEENRPLLEDVNDKTSIKFSNEEKANILQNQFCSVFNREHPYGGIPKLARRTDISIHDLFITKEMIEKEIKDMNVNKSCGPDELHPRMLKELISIMSRPIALLLNKSISQRVMWKQARMSHLFIKKVREIVPKKYRPISLTSILC